MFVATPLVVIWTWRRHLFCAVKVEKQSGEAWWSGQLWPFLWPFLRFGCVRKWAMW
jgi:hypothetical protein